VIYIFIWFAYTAIVVVFLFALINDPLQLPQYLLILGFALVTTIAVIDSERRRRKIRKAEWKESIQEGAIEEPRPVRPLTEVEEILLVRHSKHSRALLKYLCIGFYHS